MSISTKKNPRSKNSEALMVLELEEARKGELMSAGLVDQLFNSRDDILAWLANDAADLCRDSLETIGRTPRAMLAWLASRDRMIVQGGRIVALIELEERNGVYWAIARDVHNGRIEERQVDLSGLLAA